MPSLQRHATKWLAPLSFALFFAGTQFVSAAPAEDVSTTSAEQQKLTEQYIQTAFSNMDANHDGKIDQAEFHAFMLKYLARQEKAFENDFAAADTNHDGKLSRAEVQKANPLVAKYFDKTDANHDGFLSKDEIRTAIRTDQLQVALHGDNDDDDAPASAASSTR